ncbi:MAG: SRPBCC domain-containing protein [Kofleriaceae bacterium]
MSKLTLEIIGDTGVVITRRFAAPPAAVFQAHTDPALVQQWCLGPDGWTMPVCICDARPGGAIRYEWSDGGAGGFYLTGEFIEVEAPHRLVHVERMHLPPPGPNPTPDNRIETTFVADGAGTLLTMRMQLPDAVTRDAMLATGMEHGMEASYVRLEERWSS